MKDLDQNVMGKALKEVISLCGIESLTDEARFQAAIKDFLHGSMYSTEQQILIFAVKIGIGRELVKAAHKAAAEQNRALTVANDLLANEYGFKQKRCNRILAAFIFALEWKNAAKNSNPFVRNTLISFGQYKWQILDVTGKAALLLSNDITDVGIPYNREMGNTSWENCSLRRWLNSDFLVRFSREQEKKILRRTVRAENNPWYQTNAGNATEDKVFLLSISEVIRYFGDSGSLENRPKNRWTDEVEGNGAASAIDDPFNISRRASFKNEGTWWWLRSPGQSESKAAYVNAEGMVLLNGESVFDDGGTSCAGIRPGVRPAIWLQQ